MYAQELAGSRLQAESSLNVLATDNEVRLPAYSDAGAWHRLINGAPCSLAGSGSAGESGAHAPARVATRARAQLESEDELRAAKALALAALLRDDDDVDDDGGDVGTSSGGGDTKGNLVVGAAETSPAGPQDPTSSILRRIKAPGPIRVLAHMREWLQDALDAYDDDEEDWADDEDNVLALDADGGEARTAPGMAANGTSTSMLPPAVRRAQAAAAKQKDGAAAPASSSAAGPAPPPAATSVAATVATATTTTGSAPAEAAATSSSSGASHLGEERARRRRIEPPLPTLSEGKWLFGLLGIVDDLLDGDDIAELRALARVLLALLERSLLVDQEERLAIEEQEEDGAVAQSGEQEQEQQEAERDERESAREEQRMRAWLAVALIVGVWKQTDIWDEI